VGLWLTAVYSYCMPFFNQIIMN